MIGCNSHIGGRILGKGEGVGCTSHYLWQYSWYCSSVHPLLLSPATRMAAEGYMQLQKGYTQLQKGHMQINLRMQDGY